MNLKYTIYFSLFAVCNPLQSQNWSIFNDSLTYYYQASNTGDYYTLRIDYLEIGDGDTSVFFVDNYIPNDTVDLDEDFIYYSYNGSILGKLLNFGTDTVSIDSNYYLYRSMSLGETRLFCVSDLRDITFISQTDSTLFGIADSVRYYNISDGTQIILSKSFGLLSYPKQNSDFSIQYALVGIEGMVGLNFDHHNQIFDFEIGDRFIYLEKYYFYIGDSRFDQYTLLNAVDIFNKFLIDGHYHYDVGSYAGDFYYPIYPPIFPENTLFDHPGEQVKYCRANDVYSSERGEIDGYFLIDNQKFITDHLGHRYETSPDGNLIQIVGGKAPIDYETFGIPKRMDEMLSEGLHYEESTDSIFKEIFPQTSAIYEEGYGMTYFYWEGGFNEHLIKRLFGAVISGDTLGMYGLDIPDEHRASFNFYPNPTTNTVYLESPLSKISIYNSSGELICFEEDGSEINVSILADGVYIIQGIDNVGVLRYGKFIKN